MSQRTSRVSKKASLAQEQNTNVNPILKSEKKSRKRKAGSDPHPMSKGKRTEKKSEVS